MPSFLAEATASGARPRRRRQRLLERLASAGGGGGFWNDLAGFSGGGSCFCERGFSDGGGGSGGGAARVAVAASWPWAGLAAALPLRRRWLGRRRVAAAAWRERAFLLPAPASFFSCPPRFAPAQARSARRDPPTEPWLRRPWHCRATREESPTCWLLTFSSCAAPRLSIAVVLSRPANGSRSLRNLRRQRGGIRLPLTRELCAQQHGIGNMIGVEIVEVAPRDGFQAVRRLHRHRDQDRPDRGAGRLRLPAHRDRLVREPQGASRRWPTRRKS